MHVNERCTVKVFPDDICDDPMECQAVFTEVLLEPVLMRLHGISIIVFGLQLSQHESSFTDYSGPLNSNRQAGYPGDTDPG
jgi:hypothetical protein